MILHHLSYGYPGPIETPPPCIVSVLSLSLAKLQVPDSSRDFAAQLCIALGIDGLRGDLTLVRAARALAALQGDKTVGRTHLQRVAPSALRHRLRRNPLDDSGSSTRVERALAELAAP